MFPNNYTTVDGRLVVCLPDSIITAIKTNKVVPLPS